jgi:hypothetical protein
MSVEQKRYLTAAQLRARYGGVSHMWIERRLKDEPRFPHPQKFGRLRFWELAQIEAYERAAARGTDDAGRAAAREPFDLMQSCRGLAHADPGIRE